MRISAPDRRLDMPPLGQRYGYTKSAINKQRPAGLCYFIEGVICSPVRGKQSKTGLEENINGVLLPAEVQKILAQVDLSLESEDIAQVVCGIFFDTVIYTHPASYH